MNTQIIFLFVAATCVFQQSAKGLRCWPRHNRFHWSIRTHPVTKACFRPRVTRHKRCCAAPEPVQEKILSSEHISQTAQSTVITHRDSTQTRTILIPNGTKASAAGLSDSTAAVNAVSNMQSSFTGTHRAKSSKYSLLVGWHRLFRTCGSL